MLQEFDFNQLEKSTEYDGGFTEKSQTIIDFWDIVHNLSIESKKKLLEFTTGKYINCMCSKYSHTLFSSCILCKVLTIIQY